jgi:hypothetical protein
MKELDLPFPKVPSLSLWFELVDCVFGCDVLEVGVACVKPKPFGLVSSKTLLLNVFLSVEFLQCQV